MVVIIYADFIKIFHMYEKNFRISIFLDEKYCNPRSVVQFSCYTHYIKMEITSWTFCSKDLSSVIVIVLNSIFIGLNSTPIVLLNNRTPFLRIYFLAIMQLS